MPAASTSLGIDLSTSAKKTAGCRLEWADGRCSDGGRPPEVGLADKRVLELMGDADSVGIDCPFGWPDDFVTALDGWSREDRWDAGTDRAPLRYRLTDLEVKSRFRAPLSVSTDRIGSTAMRCAQLLRRHYAARGEDLDRVHGHVAEVYPAVALHAWSLTYRGYKTAHDARAKRREIVGKLRDKARLDLCVETVELCVGNDDALDALVASLVARARSVGRVLPVPLEGGERVRREGWIHVPERGSLVLLCSQTM